MYKLTAMLFLAAAWYMGSHLNAHGAEAVKGATGIVCTTAQDVIDFNQQTALLSDDQFDAVVGALKGPCWAATLTGMLTETVATFTRRDNKVIDVLRYEPILAITQHYFTYRARDPTQDVGL